MKGKKQQRFLAIKSFPNVLEYPSNTAGNWKTIFNNQNPIVLELACGKGEYSVELAKRDPNKNYIGIDIKGNRLWVGAKRSMEEGIENVRFLRIPIENIHHYFEKEEIAEIWIIYPDPFLRTSRQRKRLTHPRFLTLYQSIVVPHAHIHLKTDSPILYQFTKDVIELTNINKREDLEDAYLHADETSPIRIPTFYEKIDIAKSRKVFYLQFSIGGNSMPKEIDQELKLREINRTKSSEKSIMSPAL